MKRNLNRVDWNDLYDEDMSGSEKEREESFNREFAQKLSVKTFPRRPLPFRPKSTEQAQATGLQLAALIARSPSNAAGGDRLLGTASQVGRTVGTPPLAPSVPTPAREEGDDEVARLKSDPDFLKSIPWSSKRRPFMSIAERCANFHSWKDSQSEHPKSSISWRAALALGQEYQEELQRATAGLVADHQRLQGPSDDFVWGAIPNDSKCMMSGALPVNTPAATPAAPVAPEISSKPASPPPSPSKGTIASAENSDEPITKDIAFVGNVAPAFRAQAMQMLAKAKQQSPSSPPRKKKKPWKKKKA